MPDSEPAKPLEVVWEAQPKQSDFISCPADDVGYGGSRGGGKTDAIFGDWISHEDMYGSDAIGIIFRRQRTQLLEMIERGKTLLPRLRFVWKDRDSYFAGPHGGRLRFAYLESDSDADAYQGHGYCVAVGTRIRMGDGSLKSIECIGVGETVATLEGPRRVSAVTRPYVADCVEAVVHDALGWEIGRQVHPATHPVLTTAGLTSSQLLHERRSDAQPQSERPCRDIPDRESFSCADRVIPAWLSWSACERSDCISSRLTRAGSQPLRLLYAPVVLHAPSLRPVAKRCCVDRSATTLFHVSCTRSRLLSGLGQGWICFVSGLRRLAEHARQALGRYSLYLPSVPSCAPSDSRTVPSSQCDCVPDPRSCDEHALGESKSAPNDTPSQAYVGSRFQSLLAGELDTTPSRSRFPSVRWVHPYSGEERCLLEDVTWGTMELRPCGEALVADLCVESANHYISECGLINKNTRVYFEEIGTFPSEQPVAKLMATLRSGAGVPCQVKSTCNPGGPGHQWVKARYKIGQHPRGYEVFRFEYKNPFTGKMIEKTRTFIPSRVVDNKFLGDDYVANLYQVGTPTLVKAWLEGDWDIVEGAFFPEWSQVRHVIRPFTVPAEWARFRAMDWGSARPFAVLWFAVAGEDYQPPGQRITIPRGALVCYREWYGQVHGQSNVGLKLTAEDVAAGIAEREMAEPPQPNGRPGVLYGVLDPSAFAESGGPSIAERMSRPPSGIFFREADNARVARKGSIGGWDQLRDRLSGTAERNEKTGDVDWSTGVPMIYFFETCAGAIGEIPGLQHDRLRPEDVDTDGVDHAADSVRYGCLSRPYVKRHAEQKEKKILAVGPTNQVSLDEVFEAAERRRPGQSRVERIR